MPATNVTVLAFDPGKHTGMAKFSAVRGGDNNYYTTEYSSHTFGPEPHHLALANNIENEAKDCHELHVVLERFDYRNSKNGLNMDARNYIGIIDLEIMKLQQAKTKLLFTNRQVPSQGKSFVKDENLRAMGLYQGISRHERDAYRHLFWYLIHKAKIMPTEFLKAGWKNV